MNTQLDSFETALLQRLRETVSTPSRGVPRRSRRSLVAAGVATAAAAAAIVVVVPGVGAKPAYSVVEGNSGTITLEVRRLQDAAGLEAALARHGVAADVTYVPRQQQCAPGRYTPVDRRLSGMGVTMGADLLRVTLPPGTVRKGETFVLAVSGAAVPPSNKVTRNGVRDAGGFSGWADFDVTAGSVGPCVVIATGSR